MTTMLVVPADDELEDGRLGNAASGPDVAVDQLGFQGREEAFGDRIVPARAWFADALAQLVGTRSSP